MMGNPGEEIPGGLGAADIQAAIDLHGVDADNLRPILEMLEEQIRLAHRGRTEEEQDGKRPDRRISPRGTGN